ncbi:hypothetical protein [Streptococcus equi]|uniref:hypothetical protein n=1 Tax=Streptococcus equi TaxID=1336 RepID=UPI001E53169C|nr:hypothetical protein [Streptococcus equi]
MAESPYQIYLTTHPMGNCIVSNTQSGVCGQIKSDKVIQPHLSTLDGIVLASLAAERYLKEQYEACEDFYLSQFRSNQAGSLLKI